MGTCTSTITVDAAPPTIIGEAKPPQFWPPNHKYLSVDLQTCMEKITDPCNPNLTAAQIVNDPSFKITYVGSDEPNSIIGSGNTTNDIYQTGSHTVKLRPERTGASKAWADDFKGRIYHVGIGYTNAGGAATTFDCRYGVPHDQGANAIAQVTTQPGLRSLYPVDTLILAAGLALLAPARRGLP